MAPQATTLQRSLLYMQHTAFLPRSPSKQGRRSKYSSRDREERGTTSYLFSSPLDIGSQMMEVMSHSFLHSRQKHIFKYQALFCEQVSNNWQYFSGVTLQDPRSRTVSFHYSWMLCSIMPILAMQPQRHPAVKTSLPLPTRGFLQTREGTNVTLYSMGGFCLTKIAFTAGGFSAHFLQVHHLQGPPGARSIRSTYK